MILVVQQIHTSWTKQSRGMPAAAARNATPGAVELPLGQMQLDHGLLLHIIRCREPVFEPQSEVSSRPLVDELTIECLIITLEDDVAHVDYCHLPHVAGAPVRARSSHQDRVFTLNGGETGQVAYNGRTSTLDDGVWAYSKWTINVGFVPGAKGDLFTAREFDHRFRDMVDLW